MNKPVFALTVFDDGSGPALYAGGTFTSAGGASANHIARWNGSSWSALGSGVGSVAEFDRVEALTVFDDGSGSGPALYAGGHFMIAGGVAAFSVAKWNGSSWSALGIGIDDGLSYVRALAVFDDGGGPALYAGGTFDTAGGVEAFSIAKWTGSSWSPLGSGIGAGFSTIYALAVFDDGSGSALYTGGSFAIAGGMAVKGIAKWDGSIWSPVGDGIGDLSPQVLVLMVLDNGSGPALYAGGDLTTAGGETANFIATWNGTSWSTLGSGMSGYAYPWVQALTVFDDGNGAGPALYAGGSFATAGGVAVNRIAKWNGADWSGLGEGSGLNNSVSALAVFDDGSGPALYVGGSFTTVGSMPANRIAKWDGTSWSPLGSGISGGFYAVFALAVFDDGSGPALYAGGYFFEIGGVSASNIAKWNGSSWEPVGKPIVARVYTLTVFDDGSGAGEALYAGGSESSAGCVAKWDGSSWTPLGSGIGSPHEPAVYGLVGFDDGSGPALYAGGNFTMAGGAWAISIARWKNSSWSPLGSGMGGPHRLVYALAVFDDGSGNRPALYATGSFTTAGGVAANRIAKWNGLSWSPLLGGLDWTGAALTVFDDGSGAGPELVVSGSVTNTGGIPAVGIAKWNGASWSPLGSGLNGGVAALTVFDDGSGGGAALFAGGGMSSVDSGDWFMAKWGGCAPPPVFTDLGSGLAGITGIPSLAGTGTLKLDSPGTLTLSDAAPSSLAVLFVSLSSTPMPFKCGTLMPVPVLSALVLSTDAGGTIPLGWSVWPAGLSGRSLYLQYAVDDAAAVCDVALSNALRADVP